MSLLKDFNNILKFLARMLLSQVIIFFESLLILFFWMSNKVFFLTKDWRRFITKYFFDRQLSKPRVQLEMVETCDVDWNKKKSSRLFWLNRIKYFFLCVSVLIHNSSHFCPHWMLIQNFKKFKLNFFFRRTQMKRRCKCCCDLCCCTFFRKKMRKKLCVWLVERSGCNWVYSTSSNMKTRERER